MTILVTGASGHLGRHVVEALLDRGAAPDQIVAGARDTDKVADLAERGVVTRRVDYDDPASLDGALAGVDRVLLVSSSEIGARVQQHERLISAAETAGVDLLAYTSIANIDRSSLILAQEHRATEQLLADSPVPTVLLRNGWYLENYTENLDPALATGTAIGSAGDGRVSGASRRDYAEAAAAVLLADDQAGRIHELGGDEAFSMADFAAELSRVTAKEITYRDLSPAAHIEALRSAGVPQPFAEVLADSDAGVARGELYVDSSDLSDLIGRPTTPLREAVQAAVA